MRKFIIRSTSVASLLLLAGAALAGGPINPPPASCAVDEVYKCETIGGQKYCKCAKRDLSAAPQRNDEPRRLKGKPQHLVNHGSGATGQTPATPQPEPRKSDQR